MKYRNENFLKMYRDGVLIREIADRFGVGRRSVEDWVLSAIKNGILDRRPTVRSPLSGRRPADPEMLARLKELWEAGTPSDVIGVELGRKGNSIRALASRYGFHRKTSVARAMETSEVEARVRELKSAGLDDKSVAVQIGISEKSVYRVRQRIGDVKAREGSVPIVWTEDLVATLTELWNQKKGPTEIAQIMGLTRLSVEGKASRLKLPRHGSALVVKRSYAHLHTPETRRKVAEANRQRMGKPRAVPKTKAKVVEPQVIPLTARPWLTRKRGECAYPYGERGNIHSCCDPIFGETVYCEAHAGLCFDYFRSKAA